MRKIRTTIATVLAGGLAVLPSESAPLAVGTIADDVGYSEGIAFNGSTYQSLTQRRAGDHPDTVLALVFATPW